jgi:choice-of-anchor B domain-containing protein
MKRTILSISLVITAAISAMPLSAQSFGNAVTVLGEQIFVGEPVYEMRSGVVYVFEQDASGTWNRAQLLEPADSEMGNRFGISLAGQDDLLLVSATRADGGTGAVYTYENNGGSWSETGRLVTDDRSPADSLGSGLAIDGDWIMVGTIAQNSARGAAYAFRRDGDNWVQHSKFAPTGLMPEARFGSKIALSGEHMFISAATADEGQGAVYAYRYDAATDSWNETGALEAPLVNPQAAFGSDMAIVDDIALVGAPGNIVGIGSVIAYAFDEDAWQVGTMLIPFEAAAQTGFGGSISFDGETALIGAATAGLGEGRAFSYTLDAETLEWTSVTQSASGAPSQEFFGADVVMGETFAVGSAPGGDNGTGAAWVLEPSAGGWVATALLGGDNLGIDAIAGDEIRCTDDGQAALFECSSVDLLSFIPLADMEGDRGINTNDVWGWTDPESGREIVLVGMTNQTAFVDITNPGNPLYLGRLPMPEGSNVTVWRDMKVYDNHMFVVADNAGEHGMQVFDLTHLRDLDGSDPVTFTEDARYDRIASAHNIVVNEDTGFAYSVGSSGGGETCGGGLHMIDVRDPKNPEFAGCFQDMTTGRDRTGYSHDAQCVVYHGPDEDYAGREICLGANETALSIADVTDKSAPVAVAMATYPNVAYSHQGWLSEDHQYFYMGDELDETGGNVATTRTLIWDLADLDDPILAREYMADTKATDHNLYIVGNTMYQSNYKSGLRVLDVSDPENPVPVGSFDTVPYGGDDAQMDGSWSNYPYFESGVVAVTSSSEGLFIVRYRPRTISQ